MKVGLDGQVIIITGAASGIGRAIAREAAASGAEALVITDIDAAELEATASDISRDTKVHVHVGDLSEATTMQAIASASLEEFGRIDGLVNAAGITTRASFTDGTDANWETIFAINTRAPFFLMQQTILDLQKRNAPGSIVNIQSINAHCGSPELAIYSASKGALLTMTKNAANAHVADRIRVNGINLGWALTEGEHDMQSRVLGKGDDWLKEATASRTLGSLISPEETARLSIYLLSPASAPLTGATMDLEHYVSGAPK